MLCPVCEVELRISDRQGVEIDYCPKCRGVWLDKGELDKLIERSNQQQTYRDEPDYDDDYDYGSEYKRKNSDMYPPQYPSQQYPPQRDEQPYPQKRRKKSFLDDVFDIFD